MADPDEIIGAARAELEHRQQKAAADLADWKEQKAREAAEQAKAVEATEAIAARFLEAARGASFPGVREPK